MRIGQYSDSFLPVVDGVGRVVFSYAKSLGNMGHQCTVFAPMANMGYLGDYPFQVIDYNSFQMPGKMPYRVGLPQLDARFHKKTQMTKMDIVHVHSPFMLGHSGLQVAKKRRLPVVATFHSKFYDDFKMTLKSETLARAATRQVVEFFEQCDEVWAVSESSGQTLTEYGFRGEVIAMPNGTEIRALDEAVLPELRERFSLREGVPILLYVGQLNWKKNILHILEAVRLLREKGCAFRLLLAGQGPHRDEIEQKINEWALSDQVTFPGHIDNTRDLDGLYALADLFVFPSLYDNAPMVLREAAAMGTPALLIEGSNAAECIVSGVNALTCRDEPVALADTIAKGLTDPALLDRLGQAARETIPVPWTRLMDQVIHRYQALIGRKAEAASRRCAE